MLIVAHIVGLRAVEDESFPMLPITSTTSISNHAVMLMANSATAAGGGGGGGGNNARDHRAGSVTSLTSNDSLHESIATNNSNHNNNTESISAAKLLFQDCAQGDDDKPVRARRIEYKPPPQVTHLTSHCSYHMSLSLQLVDEMYHEHDTIIIALPSSSSSSSYSTITTT